MKEDKVIGGRRFRADWRSTAEGASEDEGGWKCRKHAAQPRHGVCASCLRDRLLCLCPDCANLRPCACLASPSSSSLSPSPDELDGSGGGAGVGAVGRVSRLIESEPAFLRSRSMGLPVLRSRSVASDFGLEAAPQQLPSGGGSKGWAALWPFSWATGKRDSVEAKLCKSRSDAGGLGGGGEKGKSGRRWHFPRSVTVFRRWKSTNKVEQERSPVWRR